jgi:hypothetical protein
MKYEFVPRMESVGLVFKFFITAHVSVRRIYLNDG